MAPCTPAVSRGRGARGARNAPSSAPDRGAGEGRGSRGVDVKLGQVLPTRETRRESVIVINSDSDDSEDDESDSGPEPVPPFLPPLSVGSSARTVEAGNRMTRASTAELPTPRGRFSGLWDLSEFKTPTKKTGSGLSVKDTGTPSAGTPSTFLDGTYPTKKTTVLAPRQSASSTKDKNLTSRRSLDVPSILASSRTLDSTYSPKPLFAKVEDAGDNKTNVNSWTSRQQVATTASSTSTITVNQTSTLLRNSSSILPSTLPPAVKSRVYSTPRPTVKRNIDNESNKLEAFGLLSAASLVAGTATPITRNAAAAAVTPTPIPKSNSISHSITKPIYQDDSGYRNRKPLQVQNKTSQPLPRTTQNYAAAVTPVSRVEVRPASTPTRRGTIQVQTSSLQPLPQTPQNPTPAKQAPTSSGGSYGGPYAISSDSDSDDEDGNGTPDNTRSLKSLGSFAEPADAHETASDVEAVLNQFPVWLNSPSPAELGSSYLATPTPPRPTAAVRPSTTPRPNKRSLDDAGRASEQQGSEKRRVRFAGLNELSPSPTKRVVISREPGHGLSARRISSPFPSSASSFVGIAAPGRKTTAVSVRPNANRHGNPNPNLNSGSNSIDNHHQIREEPLSPGESTLVKQEEKEDGQSGGEKKKKRKKKKKTRPGPDKVACRHRNRRRRKGE